MAITTASISPCLQVDPENTTSPSFLVTGSDSPVRADWNTRWLTINVTNLLVQNDRPKWRHSSLTIKKLSHLSCPSSQSSWINTHQDNRALQFFKQTGLELRIISQTWSILKASPSSRRASAGTISPSLILIISPGTNTMASSSFHRPSRKTCELLANKQDDWAHNWKK